MKSTGITRLNRYEGSRCISKVKNAKLNPNIKRYVITQELKKSVKLRKSVGGKYVNSSDESAKSSSDNTDASNHIESSEESSLFNRTKATNQAKVYYSKEKHKNIIAKSENKSLSKDLESKNNDTIKTEYNFPSINTTSKKITLDEVKSLNRISESNLTSKSSYGKSGSKYFLDKALNKLEDNENDGLSDFTIQGSLDARRRYISTKKSLLTVKKGYYIANNINEKINSSKIKQINISRNINKAIKSKKINIYKNYSLRNFLEDSLENKMVRNAKVNYNYTGDTTSEAAKMTVEKGYDTAKASKAIVYKAKKVENLIRNGKIKDKNIKNYKVNQHSMAKNIRKQQSLAKTKYIKDLKRKELLKKGQKIAKNTSVKAGKFAMNSLYKSSATLVKAIGAKFVVIGLIALLVFLALMQMMGGIMGSTSSYKLIGAEEKVIGKYQDSVSKLDSDLEKEVQKMAEEEADNYDDVVVDIYGEDGHIATNFKEILVLNTVFFEQNIDFKQEEIDKINQWHKKMNPVSRKTERYHCSGCQTRYCSSDNCSGHSYCPGHTRLRIIVNCKSMEDIIDDIDFTDFQKDWARELMLCDLNLLHPGSNFEVEGGISGFSGLSQEEIANILVNLPETGVKREEILNNAVSLVGKVKYFWGGKSSAGWNDNWGKPREVTAPGTSDYGKSIPYGLDCSGFVDWAYKTSGINVLGAGGTAYQWNQSYGVDKKSAKPGDLVFKNPPNSNGINHVGIYIGKDKKTGKDQFVHCSYDKGVTIDSWSGFKYYRRVKVKLD